MKFLFTDYYGMTATTFRPQPGLNRVLELI